MSSMANRRSIMVLYSDQTTPIGHAVRIVLAEKDINVEINYVDGNRPEELNELNPYGDVLTLIDRDLVLYEAQIIMEYLDERFPHPPLMPVDPVARATNRQFRYRVMRDLYALIEDIENGSDSSAAAARKTMRDNLTALTPMFAQKPYFVSDEYSLVDCCMAPLIWRLNSWGVKLPASTKALVKYGERLFSRAAFRDSLSSHERELNK
jgi:RNA polymerase-associated protein